MTWLAWTLISVLSLIAYYFFVKRLFNSKNESDPRLYGGLLQLTVGLLALGPAILTGWHFELTALNIILLCAVAVTYTVGPSLYYTGLKHTDLSVTTVLDASGAVYSVILGALFLKESFDITKLIGVGFIIVAILTVSGKVRALKKFNFYESILIVAPFFYAVGAVLDKILSRSSNTLTYLCLSFLVAGITMTLVNIPRLYKSHDKSIKNFMFLKTVFINAFFVFIYGFATFKAYDVGGEVSKMYPIAQSESVIVPFLAIFLLGEKENFKYKLIASFIAFTGILLLK